MKKLIILILTLLSICWTTADARFPRGDAFPNPNLRQQGFFGLTGSAWQTPSNYYVPGTGNPAVSTSDYYHSDGVYWLRPYDLLDSACGATGISIAASRGRYVWMHSTDHGDDTTAWADGGRLFIGFSNDPGVPPSKVDVFYTKYQSTPLAQTATITASIGNGVGGAGNSLIVTAVTGAVPFDNNAVVTGTGVTQASITAQASGTPAGIGTYTIGGAAQNVASRTMTISNQNYYVYLTPFLVCNPDDASFPFYVYAEGSGDSGRTQNETGYVKSADLITWSSAIPTHIVYGFGPFSSYQRVVRTGVNSWYSTGYQAFFPQTSNAFGYAKWTSTDGVVWNTAVSLFSTCLPVNASGVPGAQPCTAATATFSQPSAAPPRVTVGAQDYLISNTNSMVNGTRVGNQWVTRAPIDANFNVTTSPAIVNVSSAYSGFYPGPTYMNEVSSYVEDGVAHYYAAIGFPPSNGILNGTAQARSYLNSGACIQSVGTFAFTGSIAATTLHVTATPYTITVGSQLMYGPTATFVTAQITTQGADVATYTVDVSQTYSSGSITAATCGGLWQQNKDYYTEIIDATIAATAAPIGVKASCSSSVSSLVWFNALPQQTYRLYRGTTSGSQPTLVGDFTGTTATDSSMTLNAVTYYKLVYLHSGVEQKNRIVSTYCSTSSAFVNAHMTRALAAGADATTCNRAGTGLSMDAFDNWLTSNGLSNNLLFATATDFCVAKSGSNISKIFDMGTTRLPRGGDYTPSSPANTTYNATGISGKPAWVNGANTAYGYYGAGRFNNIRRKVQITLFAAYQKPGTAEADPFVIGQFTNRMMLSHTSGTPGAINCLLSDATQQKTATATVAGLATDFHTASCSFDGTTWLAYSDAVAGSGQTGLVIPSPTLTATDMLTGQMGGPASINTLLSGGQGGLYNTGTLTYDTQGNTALYSGRVQIIFDVNLTSAQQTSLDALVR